MNRRNPCAAPCWAAPWAAAWLGRGASQSSGGSTSINVSGRQATQVSIKKVDGKTAMTDAEVYAANVNSVVSINVHSTSS